MSIKRALKTLALVATIAGTQSMVKANCGGTTSCMAVSCGLQGIDSCLSGCNNSPSDMIKDNPNCGFSYALSCIMTKNADGGDSPYSKNYNPNTSIGSWSPSQFKPAHCDDVMDIYRDGKGSNPDTGFINKTKFWSILQKGMFKNVPTGSDDCLKKLKNAISNTNPADAMQAMLAIWENNNEKNGTVCKVPVSAPVEESHLKDK